MPRSSVVKAPLPLWRGKDRRAGKASLLVRAKTENELRHYRTPHRSAQRERAPKHEGNGGPTESSAVTWDGRGPTSENRGEKPPQPLKSGRANEKQEQKTKKGVAWSIFFSDFRK